MVKKKTNIHIDGKNIKIRGRTYKVGCHFGRVPEGKTCVVRKQEVFFISKKDDLLYIFE